MDCGMPKLPSPLVSPRVCSNSCPLSQRCHSIISPSVAPFSSCLQSFPASGSFPVSWLFTSGGQSIGASNSTSVFLMNIQGWLTLGLISLISLLSKGPSRVFSNTMVQKHQFFGTQPSLWSSSHTRTWLLEKPYLWLYGLLTFTFLHFCTLPLTLTFLKFIYPFIHSPVYLTSHYPSIYVFIHISLHLSILSSVCPSIHLFLHLCSHLSILKSKKFDNPKKISKSTEPCRNYLPVFWGHRIRKV